MMAPSPEGQRLVSRKALSFGGRRERSGRGEFFTRSRMIGTTHSKARNVCSVSARYHASSFKAIMRGVPREKARSEPVGSAPPAASGCLTAVRLSPRYPLYVPKAASLHCAAFDLVSDARPMV